MLLGAYKETEIDLLLAGHCRLYNFRDYIQFD